MLMPITRAVYQIYTRFAQETRQLCCRVGISQYKKKNVSSSFVSTSLGNLVTIEWIPDFCDLMNVAWEAKRKFVTSN